MLEYMAAAGAVTGLVSSLVATYVTLTVRAGLSEIRREIAETENRIVDKINGRYVRKEVFDAIVSKGVPLPHHCRCDQCSAATGKALP